MEARLILVALMSCENHPGAKLAEGVSLNAQRSVFAALVWSGRELTDGFVLVRVSIEHPIG